MNQQKIMLIDDNQLSNAVLNDILVDDGYPKPIIVRSANEALQLFTRNDIQVSPCDLIITDLVMPGMDGITFCQQIKTYPRFKDIPIIVVTASENIEDLKASFAAGVHDYIQKPYRTAAVLARIHAALRMKSESDKLREREWQLARKNAVLTEDLAVARELQLSLLPPSLDTERYAISGHCRPMEYLGGDLYHWDVLDENRLGLAMLDVMGHGAAPSMICMYIRSLLSDAMHTIKNPVQLIHYLNQVVIDFNSQLQNGQYFITMLYGVLDIHEHTLTTINAGHPPAYFIYDGKSTLLEKGCLPIGVVPQITIETDITSFSDAATLLLYSDGFGDCMKYAEMDLGSLATRFHRDQIAHTAFQETVSAIINKDPRALPSDDVSVVLLSIKSEGR